MPICLFSAPFDFSKASLGGKGRLDGKYFAVESDAQVLDTTCGEIIERIRESCSSLPKPHIMASPVPSSDEEGEEDVEFVTTESKEQTNIDLHKSQFERDLKSIISKDHAVLRHASRPFFIAFKKQNSPADLLAEFESSNLAECEFENAETIVMKSKQKDVNFELELLDVPWESELAFSLRTLKPSLLAAVGSESGYFVNWPVDCKEKTEESLIDIFTSSAIGCNKFNGPKIAVEELCSTKNRTISENVKEFNDQLIKHNVSKMKEFMKRNSNETLVIDFGYVYYEKTNKPISFDSIPQSCIFQKKLLQIGWNPKAHQVKRFVEYEVELNGKSFTISTSDGNQTQIENVISEKETMNFVLLNQCIQSQIVALNQHSDLAFLHDSCVKCIQVSDVTVSTTKFEMYFIDLISRTPHLSPDSTLYSIQARLHPSFPKTHSSLMNFLYKINIVLSEKLSQ